MADRALSPVPEIIHEEEHFFIVNKPPGYYSHPNYLGHQVKSLVTFFQDKMNFSENSSMEKEEDDWDEGEDDSSREEESDQGQLRQGLVHRLDRDTCGLVIMAKNPSALKMLQDLFRQRMVRKRYRALVHGHWFEHQKLLVHNLIRDPYRRSRRKVWKDSSGEKFSGRRGEGQPFKVAETEVSPIAFFKDKTLLEVEIFTGRTHQIRVQLAHEGFPVVGDVLYGPRHRRGGVSPSELMLCAYSLEFINPFSGKNLSQQISLPAFFEGYLGRLDKYQLSVKRK